MSFVQGLLVQKFVYPAMLLPTRSKTTSLARTIRKRQRWPLARLQQMQLQRMNDLCNTAANGSEFYRKKFDELNIDCPTFKHHDELPQIPVTTKADIEANFPDGMVIAQRRNTDWQYVGTRGTTHRVMVVHDFPRRDIGRAGGMVALTEDSPYCYGAREVTIPPDACSVHCGIESNRADSVSGQLWMLASRKIRWDRESISDLRGLVMNHWIKNSLSLPPMALEKGDDEFRSYVEMLRQHPPVQLMALPEYLRGLAEYIHRTEDRPPPIPIVRPMGANMPEPWKEELATAFRGQVREHYGSREMGPMAFDCRHTNGMHLMMDQHLIEVIRDGRPAKPGEVGNVVVTDLNNHAMPMIRYEIGDLARIEYEPCPCGRNTPRLFLEGRFQDAFVADDGKVLTADAVSAFFTTEPEIRDFQLTEDRRGKWDLRVVPLQDATIDLQALGDRLLEWAGISRTLNTRLVTAIRPESSGKFRHCKSESFHSLIQEPVEL